MVTEFCVAGSHFYCLTLLKMEICIIFLLGLMFIRTGTELSLIHISLRGVTIKAPVHIGDIVLENVAGTGVNIVAAGNVDAVH